MAELNDWKRHPQWSLTVPPNHGDMPRTRLLFQSGRLVAQRVVAADAEVSGLYFLDGKSAPPSPAIRSARKLREQSF